MPRCLYCLVVFLTLWNLSSFSSAQGRLVPHELHANGKTITLALPAEYSINVAAEGLRRVRFLAKAPDGRIFATDMYSRADNTRGRVLILEDWDAGLGRFAHITPYLQQLRNPNSIAFYTDASGQSWLYLALTDKLVRYRYKAGDLKPSGEPQTLAQYPAYGLDYKYGGWHLTRTVTFGKVLGRDRMFVAVGSSCNACIEKEPVRATISVMDPDGAHSKVLMRNVRNAVGLRWDADTSRLLATNMGDDQLGDRSPDDTLLAVSVGQIAAVEAGGNPLDAGWPYCFVQGSEVRPDPVFGKDPAADCEHVLHPLTAFAAHSSPLGVEKLTDAGGTARFVVALHGAGHPRIGTGYRVVTISKADGQPHDFLTGFLATVAGKPIPVGRPCGLLMIAPGQLLVTDDLLGAIYLIRGK